MVNLQYGADAFVDAFVDAFIDPFEIALLAFASWLTAAGFNLVV